MSASARPVLTVKAATGLDVVTARRRARQIAGHAGLNEQEQVRFATAVSEIARNAVEYGGGGTVRFALLEDPRPALEVVVEDQGPGIADVSMVLEGRLRSAHGMGVGLIGSRRIVDDLQVTSAPGKGTRVRLVKNLPEGLPAASAAALAGQLAGVDRADPVAELKVSDQDLVRALLDLSRREQELSRVNRELEETNRGVVALYAELDEKAESLRAASEHKTRFLSNMTHEFRTPVNSITSLAQMLLDQADGPLNPEQHRQVSFIRRAAHSLSEFVNDLLDLAKVEAGKVSVRAQAISAHDVIQALRGMMRAFAAQNPNVQLALDDPPPELMLVTDEGKLSQILRNLVVNALKFTERGEVRVEVREVPGDRVVFEVTDTGVGIKPEDQERIFQEFEQIEGPMQRNYRGTGLGLPLSRSLAVLLGGQLTLRSEPGKGSSFQLELPRDVTTGPRAPAAATDAIDPAKAVVLVLQGDAGTRVEVGRLLTGPSTQVFLAATLAEARDLLRRAAPALIVMDVLLPSGSAWEFLEELRRSPATARTRIAVLTDEDNESRARRLGAHAFSLKPFDPAWLEAQRDAATRGSGPRALVVDDDEIARYLTRTLLSSLGFTVEESDGGSPALERLRATPPDLVVLDVLMPDMNGLEMLAALQQDPATAALPVIIHTSALLSEADRERLSASGVPLLPKHSGSREAALESMRAALKSIGFER